MVPAVAAAGLGALGQIGSGILQGFQNRAQRKWNEEQYNRQRQDALADWNMQNEYNSPRAQMQRFQEAGLNPNLIYGQQTNSPTVRSTDIKAWNPQAPTFNPESVMATFYNTKQAQAQLDLLAVQKTLQTNNALLTASKAATETIKQAKGEFELSQARKLAEGNLQLQQLNLQKMTQDIDLSQKRFMLSLSENDRRNALAASSLREAIQRIVESKQRVWLGRFQGQRLQQEIENLKKQNENLSEDVELKRLEKQLREKGLNSSDPAYLRMLNMFLNKHFPQIAEDSDYGIPY